ncbi:putative MFS family arabinose efflux permease [Paraburkholderia eburnea]|uniref:Putative MFS family arabinose efflux permease n=1 Tax=Paraburkholderia eburnea TaxID=1189126 RepID=A0A2S4M6A7_9BURK|nr:MFS transporter [Paraburkholderia eburnea]POR50231.1 putative MFS family arabinose efflux permease [Paraburkholderia eburnea]PRZ20488.1 putative MFS family arabinose efflux permease [Paraburkholderia eburnea]
MSGKPLRAAFFLCGCAAFLNLYATQGILRELAAAFGVSAEHAGQGVSATTLAVAIIAPFVGTIAAPYARRTVIAGAAMVSALPALWAAHAGGFASFLAARFAVGMLMPFVFAISVSFIGECFSREEAAEVSALFVAGTTLGGFAGRFVTNACVAGLGWRHALDVVAALSLAAGAAIYAWLPRQAPMQAEARARDHVMPSRLQLFTRPSLLAAFGFGACVLASQVATFTFAGLRLAQPPYRFGTAQIGAIYAVFLLAMVVTPLAGRIARHRSPRDLAVWAAWLALAGALLTLAHGLVPILLGLALGSTAVFVEQAAANAFISQTTDAARPTAIGLYLSFYYLGGSLGSVLPVAAWRLWGWSGCVAFVIGAQALAGLLAWRFWREDARQPASLLRARALMR